MQRKLQTFSGQRVEASTLLPVSLKDTVRDYTTPSSGQAQPVLVAVRVEIE